jgi:FkbM family methyltransferase
MIRVPAVLTRIVPAGARRFLRGLENRLFDGYCVRSYAQEGEDLVLKRLFANSPRGLYVDVGAHHPVRFSNTYLLYRRGWRGMNIDAMPGSMRAFKSMRPRDINVEAAVSDTVADLVYHAFDEPAFNGFSAKLSQQRVAEGATLLSTKTIKTTTLRELLARFLPGSQDIDLLSVDVEGHDLQVLRSMDWRRYHPKAVVVELCQFTVEGALGHPVHHYLSGLGYRLHSKLHNSCIYVLNQHTNSGI